MSVELVAIGASWGGLHAVATLLETLPRNFGAAVVIAQHRKADSDVDRLTRLLDARCALEARVLFFEFELREARHDRPLAGHVAAFHRDDGRVGKRLEQRLEPAGFGGRVGVQKGCVRATESGCAHLKKSPAPVCLCMADRTTP